MPSTTTTRRAVLLALLSLAACSGGGSGAPGLTLVPARITLSPGGQQPFAARKGGAAVAGVTWSVRQGAAGGAISAAGLYTAPTELGTYTVVALDEATGASGEAEVTVAGALATTHGLTIPTAHPRLWLVGDRLARARAWFQANPFTPPTNEDSAGGWADVALHGLLTNDATGSCTAAIGWALSRLGDVRDTGGVACDPCRWTGEQLILVHDWCHAYLTPAQRAAFRAGLNPGLLAWSQNDWGGPPMYQSNYYWGYLRNELEWAITSYGENTAWAEPMLDRVLTARLAASFDPSTVAGGDSRGGVAYEGSEYGPAMAQYPIIPLTTAGLLGRDLYAETDFWREFVYGVIHATTPAPTVVPGVPGAGYTVFPFSDDEGWHERFQAQTHYFPDFMTAIASWWPDDAVGRHARQWADTVGVTPWRFVQAVDVPNAPLAFTGLPLDHFASGPGFLYGRSRWGEASTAFLLQGEDTNDGTMGHQHGDSGSFHLWRGAAEAGGAVRGRYLARETVTYERDVAGYGGAGSVNGALAIGHNSLLVDGVQPGPRYSGGEARVERLESAPGYAYLATSLAPPATALQVWRREFVFVRALETLVILDRLQVASAGATRTFLSHCETAPVLSGRSATCTVGGSALVTTTLLPGAAQVAYRVVDEGAAPYHQHRLEVDTTPGTAQSYILTVLQARDAGAASLAPSVTDGGTAWTLALDAGTSITFQKGMTSSGGAITQGGVTRAFRAGVQAMSVGPGGPSWGP